MSLDNFPKSKVARLPVERTFAVEGELAKRLKEVIYSYEGQISVVATVGVLELVKHEILHTNQ